MSFAQAGDVRCRSRTPCGRRASTRSSHRADRREDYDGYRAKFGELHISKHGIGGVQFAQIAVDTQTGVSK